MAGLLGDPTQLRKARGLLDVLGEIGLGILNIPQSAIEGSAQAVATGDQNYAVGPATNAALMTMGGAYFGAPAVENGVGMGVRSLLPSALKDADRLARAEAMDFRSNMPLEFSLAPEGEKIAAPAVKLLDGRVFTGPVSHYDALEAASKNTGIPINNIYEHILDDGFVTTGGRYVSRYEAGRIAETVGQGKVKTPVGLASEHARMEGAPTTSAVRTGATAPGLPGGAGEWGRLVPPGDEAAAASALWHRASRPAALDATGMRLSDIQATLEGAWDDGFDAVMLKNYIRPGGKEPETVVVVKDASQIRSPAAKFDPKNRNSRDLLAGIAGLAAAAGAANAPQVSYQPSEDFQRAYTQGNAF